jgi:hypothetical protein
MQNIEAVVQGIMDLTSDVRGADGDLGVWLS